MRIKFLSCIFVLFCVQSSLAPHVANAEPHDAGVSVDAVPTASSVDAGAIPSVEQPKQSAPLSEDEFEPSDAARAAYEAATSGKWKVLSGFILMLLVYASRRWLLSRVKWFKTALGGLVIAFALSLVWAVGSALAAQVALTLSLLLHALSNAAAAAGLWQWLQKLSPQIGEKSKGPIAPEHDPATTTSV